MNEKKSPVVVALLLVAITSMIFSQYVNNNGQHEKQPTLMEPRSTVDAEEQMQDVLEEIPHNIPTLTKREVMDPEIASKYGITGYLTVKPLFKENRINVERGGEIRLTIEFLFVSHVSTITETKIILDPKMEDTLMVEKINGEDRTSIKLNDYVQYEPSGIIRLKSNEPLQVEMILRVPETYPNIKMPLLPVGLDADVPIIYLMEADLIG